jgi:hypothetical protein
MRLFDLVCLGLVAGITATAVTVSAADSAVAPDLYPDTVGLQWNFDEDGDGNSDPPVFGRTRYSQSINPVISGGIVTIGDAGSDNDNRVAGRIFPITTTANPEYGGGGGLANDQGMDPTQDFAIGFDFKYNSGSTEDGVGPFHVASLEGNGPEIRLVGAQFHGGASNRFDIDLRNADTNPQATFNLDPDTWGRVTVVWDADPGGELDPGTFDVWFNDDKIADQKDTVGFKAMNGHSMQLGASTPFTGTISYDNVRIGTIVPEPATFALLGLGGLALLRRRHA